MDMQREQYLTFFMRGEEYAVSILRLKEIIEYEKVTRVPTTPAHVRGVINLRGAVLPVIDLAAKFGHGETEVVRTTCIVVVETRLRDEMLVVGIMADAVSEVVDIASDAIEPPPPFGTNVRIDFLRGMGKLDGRLVLVLDIDRVLSPVEIEQTIDAITNDAAAEVAQLSL
ncbi:MAG TPA: chemotaxis protein CheW [Thermoanaerobaculia bacterium]|nr:chemotaxis protein CheW [Thermoanaerobaculia bacterium]